MLVLGIETSCDETAIAVVENGKKVLSSVVASSLHLHKRYGGVVPEIATRYHVELISYVLEEARKKAKISLNDIDLIAAVYGPGLVGALLIGLSFAKVLSFARGIPLVGVNHIRAHLYAALMNKPVIKFPFVGLVVSGGHTHLFNVENFLKWKLIGKTLDDAAGEAFDKVAKILKLGYPGGPVIEAIAKFGNPSKIKFPRSYLAEDSLDFSFSGLKTAVLYYTRDYLQGGGVWTRAAKADVAAGFQEAIVETLVEKSIQACRKKKARRFVVGGGVIANQRLREALTFALQKQGIELCFPSIAFCQDNAAMVAGLGYQLYKKGVVSNLRLEVAPNLV